MEGHVLFLVGVIVGCLCLTTYGAPSTKQLTEMTKDDLMQKFVEFMHEDKEMAAILEQYRSESHLLSKRDAEDMDEADLMPQEKQQDGFFDRAAKFVMEIVQRFLKWINSE